MDEDLFQLGIKALITNSEGKILLLKVNSEKLKNYKGEPYWDIPGGRIHRHASILDTLIREIKEETDISEIISMHHLTTVISNIRIPLDGTDTGLILSVYVCKINDPINITLSDEHTEYRWSSSKEAVELLSIKYPKEFTDKIKEL